MKRTVATTLAAAVAAGAFAGAPSSASAAPPSHRTGITCAPGLIQDACAGMQETLFHLLGDVVAICQTQTRIPHTTLVVQVCRG